MTALEDINRRMQQENDRHKRVINDLDDKNVEKMNITNVPWKV